MTKVILFAVATWLLIAALAVKSIGDGIEAAKAKREVALAMVSR